MNSVVVPSGNLQQESRRKISFEDLVTTFLERKDLKESSEESYLSSFKIFKIYLETRSISHPTEQDIKEFKDYIMGRYLSVFTVISHLSAVKSLFSFVGARDIYPDVAKDIKVPKKPKGFMRDALTKEQAQELLKSAAGDDVTSKRDFAVLNILLRCGLRSVELCNADVGDVRYQNGTPVLWVQGKGRDCKDEFVVLTKESLSAIEEYLVLRKGVKPSEPLFLSHGNRNNKTGRLATRSVRRIVKGYLSKIGINNSRITCHSLRHTFATLALENNAPLLSVQKAMRHSNINTTLIYTHMKDRLTNGAENYIKLD